MLKKISLFIVLAFVFNSNVEAVDFLFDVEDLDGGLRTSAVCEYGIPDTDEWPKNPLPYPKAWDDDNNHHEVILSEDNELSRWCIAICALDIHKIDGNTFSIQDTMTGGASFDPNGSPGQIATAGSTIYDRGKILLDNYGDNDYIYTEVELKINAIDLSTTSPRNGFRHIHLKWNNGIYDSKIDAEWNGVRWKVSGEYYVYDLDDEAHRIIFIPNTYFWKWADIDGFKKTVSMYTSVDTELQYTIDMDNDDGVSHVRASDDGYEPSSVYMQLRGTIQLKNFSLHKH